MACGTGKTETAAWSCVGVGTREVTARIVVGLPSLNLVDQTWRRWAGMFQMPPAMAVCSDEKVGREVFRVADYGLPRASTDPGEIARFLATGGPCVVFCTYQSAEQLAEAMDSPGVPPFDFAICDEAHRLTGKGSQGAAFLDNGRIRATRRTFWTATPRIVRGDDVISMDDPKQFGAPVFTYSFGDAIRDGRLSQFQIVAVQVDDPRVSDALASDKGVEDAAVVVAVAKAMREHGLRRVISFHSLVARAAAFAEALPKVCASLPGEHRIEGVYANHIHAGTPMDVRRAELARLRSADGWTLLSNARCLGEGVDVPELDGIVFADPRTSEIEIWQAIGRAIRKSGEGKVATVLIPVFIPKGMDAEQAIEGGRFRPVFSVLKAMQAHDPSMSEVIVKWSERAKPSGMGEAKDAEPLRFMFHGSVSMAAALSAVVVTRSAVDVDWDSVPLGSASDARIAREIGVSATAVARQRIARGIEAYAPKRDIDWDDCGLGMMPDTAIAKTLGVSAGCVAHKRQERGIRPFVKELKCARCECAFRPGSAKSKFCSLRCRRGSEYSPMRNALLAAREAAHAGKQCFNCGGAVGVTRKANARFCSEKCRQKAAGKRQSVRARRAARIGAESASDSSVA
jgi:predicted helicase